MGDRLGTPGAVGFLLLNLQLESFSGKRLAKNQINLIINQRSERPQSPKNIFCKKKDYMHRPGIEPGPPAWQASILPLNQRCLDIK